MITADPYDISHAIRLGYGEPEPVEPISTRDSPENVEACQNCLLPDCRASSPACPLRGKAPRIKTHRQSAEAAERISERANRVRDLINAGWRNSEAICEELHISPWMLQDAKRRLRERGEIA